MVDLPEFDAKEYVEKACNFIKQKVEDSNSEGVVIGLSGGIDSTVVACLAVKALGSSKVKGFILPSSTTSDEDLFDADLVKTELDIQTEYILLDNIFENFLKTCKTDRLNSDNLELAYINVKPRLRMTILYYYASIYNSLVIGTGNKTELYVGYFTKYGDGGVDLSPIADLYKEDVRKLATELGIPDSIINKTPTAGLKHNQTDESELGLSYYYVDRILYLYLEKNYSTKDIASSLNIDIDKVSKIINLMKNSEHKRSLAPILMKN